ncbi:hypothetical protein VD0002_g2323 [Verticillium dahliae]|uniref:Pheromone-regulated membrane protein n=3 Tax=Verticillium TaxID=1036719 RepID=G2X483_VERDV|nr:pheromone-regulated membrane protein [Verticillium dahliae VdLs.17]KAF3347215.1 hypothetical protein VdG2_04957 [Verticillium dahliae VDG2]KAF3358306.1 hypothetical protein VdG1_02792 [Verticillium dahliae VDG1]KAH6693283.1 pheromone-regulated membrane protein [Verticillium dahliae]EGY23527.1 pheromone-regulated membrane protein [Verticillium dahliae VdLs.17]PNH29899.1 hypothetical protein BJF96_g6844 [Verticillium dahliae]
MDGSLQSQDDDDPPPANPADTGAASPTQEYEEQAQAHAQALKKEKGRVRFNSSAAATNPFLDSVAVPGLSSSAGGEPTIVQKPKPSILREPERHDVVESETAAAAAAQQRAQERARQVAAKVKRDSPSPHNRYSIDSDAAGTTYSEGDSTADGSNNIPLQDLSPRQGWQQISAEDDDRHTTEASDNKREAPAELNDGSYDGLYSVAKPDHYRGNVLSQLLQLQKATTGESSTSPSLGIGYSRDHANSSSVISFSEPGPSTPGSSGTTGNTTPSRQKWYNQNRSQDTLVNLIGASARLANPNEPKHAPDARTQGGKKRPPMHKRTGSGSRLSAFLQQREEEQMRITVHIAEIISRQDYIIKLCRALMLFGAPTHRLEEYLSTTANILEIDGQFLYLPGCMIISFDDRSTHTTEVRIVRSTQGIDLGRLKDTHHIYKEVIHDVIGAEAGSIKLDDLMKAKDKFHAWLRVVVFGLTSATAAPFSFSARLIDLPLAFCFGCLVGTLQLIVAPMSMLYSNVLEVSATVLVSFLARAFGSIRGGDLFCFSALAQSGIVMLLPGYAVLCSALELQSRAIVPGSIRIVYAVIYSLFLGFGITVGAALYGILDDNATSETTCRNPIDSYYSFIFVPLFVVCISMLYQAKWKQMPVMVVVASAGYIVNFFSGRRFVAAPQIANTLGALAVGVLANLYSRIRHGVAAATLIPAIFTQVPGGLASTGGLLSGLSTANLITNSSHEVNGTGSVQYSQGEPINTVVFNVAASMIQIAIGIAVGLFISALIIYPVGKRRSGLFSF